MLFSMAFGIFAGPAMSPQAKIFWIIGGIAMALLVWFSGAKAQRREREAKDHERAVMRRFDELNRLLAKSDTTLEDVKRMVLNTTEGADIANFRETME
jgi:hypothetical protein